MHRLTAGNALLRVSTWKTLTFCQTYAEENKLQTCGCKVCPLYLCYARQYVYRLYRSSGFLNDGSGVKVPNIWIYHLRTHTCLP